MPRQHSHCRIGFIVFCAGVMASFYAAAAENTSASAGSPPSAGAESSRHTPAAGALHIEFEHIPAAIIKRVDDYIISKVGQDYFKKNYKLGSESGGSNWNNATSYTLYYNYLPLEKIGASSEKQPIAGKFMVGVSGDPKFSLEGYCVAALKDGKPLEPTVTKARAIAIAKKYMARHLSRLQLKLAEDSTDVTQPAPENSSAYIIMPQWGAIMGHSLQEWVWNVSFVVPDQYSPVCHTYATLNVNAVTGKVDPQLLTYVHAPKPDIAGDIFKGVSATDAKLLVNAHEYVGTVRICGNRKPGEN